MPSDRINYFFIFFQFAVLECPRILNDDSSETAEFIKVWRTLKTQLQHYDLSKAKLVSSLLHTLLFFVQYTSNPASLSVAIIVCQDMQLAFFKLSILQNEQLGSRTRFLGGPKNFKFRRPYITYC